MQQKLPLEGFRLKKDKSKFTQKLRENYDDGTNKGYILEVYARFDKPLHTIHSGLSFLRDRIDIGKSQKLVCNMFDNKNYVVNKKALTQALNYGLMPENVHWVIEFNQEALLKSYVDINTELRN